MTTHTHHETALPHQTPKNQTEVLGAEITCILEKLRSRIEIIISSPRYLTENFPVGSTDSIIDFLKRPNPLLSEPEEMASSIQELQNFLLRNLKLDEIVYLDGGRQGDHKGFSIQEAVACLGDVIRTYKFSKAVQLHIQELRTQKSDTLHVVDAGCGPIPLFAIIAALSSSKVQATGIELNPFSVHIAREIVKKFGLEERIHIACEDATTYEHSAPIDLLVSETIQTALTGGEKLPAIFENLNSQMSSIGRIVPEKISVDIAIVEEHELSEKLRAIKGTHRTTLVDIPMRRIAEFDPFHPCKIITVNQSLLRQPSGKYFVVLSSNNVVLHADSGLVLGKDESVVTTPLIIPRAIPVGDENNICGFEMSYNPGAHQSDIQFRWNF